MEGQTQETINQTPNPSNEGQGQTQGQGSTSQTPPAQGLGTSGLDFIPEKYRSESWASKYDSPEKFFEGVHNLNKMIGQKEIVQGLQAPGENATPDDWNKFYNQLGRPESADKYTLPEDVKAFDGFDLDGEKKIFSELAHKNGLTQKQAEGLFKDYIANVNQFHEKSQESLQIGIDKAAKIAFGEKSDEGFDLAKRGAKALGIGNKLDSEGLSANPLVLQLCAKLGELVGEDSFIPGGSAETFESLREQALNIQRSPEYQRGDQALFDKVQDLYKRAEKMKR